jgi:two-component system NtrC family response regulator
MSNESSEEVLHKGKTLERILVVDDDKAFRVATRTLLGDEGYQVSLATNGEEALKLMEGEEFDLVLTDMVMGTMTGVDLLKRVKPRHPELPMIMVTGFGSISTAVEAMYHGAADYLTKPCNNSELLLKIRKALDAQKKDQELKMLREEIRSTYSFGNIITRSGKMKELIRQVRQVADTDVTVLIQGESGTGKELIAHALHFSSTRATGPFVPVNCSAIPENLLESELFWV